MRQKTSIIISIIVVILIAAIIAVVAYKTNFFSSADVNVGTTYACKITLDPNSGIAGSDISIITSKLDDIASETYINLNWDSWTDNTLASFSIDGLGSEAYATGAKIPAEATLGKHSIKISQAVRTSGKTHELSKRIQCTADFEVVEKVGNLPSPTTTTETSNTPSPTSTSSSTIQPTETSTPTTTIPPATTPTQTTSEIINTPSPTPTPAIPTTTTTTPIIIAPLPVITQTTTTPTPDYSIPAQPATTTPSPDISAVPILVSDDKTDSTIEADKNEMPANGSDKVTIIVTLNNDKKEPIVNATPTIEISGNANTVSEIKQDGNKYRVTLSSTEPEEKTVKVKAGDIELPEIKIAARTATAAELAKSKTQEITPWYLTWYFWLLLILALVLILTLLYSMRKRLHEQNIK